MPSHVWWTGPGPDDCVEVRVGDDEISEVVIWQFRFGDISSVNVTRETAGEIAAFMRAVL